MDPSGKLPSRKNLGHKPPFDDAEKRYAEGFAQKTRALALSLRIDA